MDPPPDSLPPTKVAVIGAGAAGLGAAWLLSRGNYTVHLYEASPRAGGHAHTIDLPLPNHPFETTIPIDAGFIVYNTTTYPDLVSLFEHLDVEQENSSMSFAASVHLPSSKTPFEWGSESPATLFADRSNLYRTSMYLMLYDMRRFNRDVHQFVQRLKRDPSFPDSDISLADFLSRGSYSSVFTHCYIAPTVSAVWSASFNSALLFPARTLFHFFVNHGLAQVFARPQWRTLTKRSRDYVNKLLHQICENGGKVLLGTPVSKVVREPDRVTIFSQVCDPQTFDQVVFATHAPTTLELLGSGATEQESNILGAFQYSSNTAYIHYDPRLMPTNRTVWSSWNFIGKRNPDANGLASSNEQLPGDQPACVSYWLNKLQNLHNFHAPVPDIFITLNPVTPIDPDKRIVELTYEHPQFTEEAVEAQPLIQSVLQGKNRSWFCGAYARYGFHEDALTTGLDVAERLSKHTIIRPWHSKQALAINDHRRLYELPHSPLRSSYFVFLGSLMVLNTVMARLGQGLRRIAQRMVDHDPIVDVAGGDGRLYRFGPPNIRSRSRSLLALNDLPPPSGSSTVHEPLRARVTVKSPRLLARIAEALRQGHELAPTAAAAFAASEFDCPTPTDLSVALRALFIADGLDLDPSKERKGRAKFAESLLYTIVGGIKKVFALPTHTRLPELTTCISNVVYPSWWLQMDETSNAVSTKNGASVMVSRGSTTDLEMSTNTLELLGDLAETTVSLLQSNKGFLATIVVLTQERIAFVTRKAELLLVRRQVSIVLLEDFLKQRKLEFELSAGLDQNQKQYDRIISPAWINVFQSSECGSLVEALEFLSSMASPGATVEMAATVFGSYRPSKPIDQGHWTDSLFCGDKGFLLWRMQDIIEAIEISHFELQSVSFMNNEEAAMDVFELIERVYSSLATEKLEPLETRLVLAQMCLWEAALDVKYLRRMALRLKLA